MLRIQHVKNLLCEKYSRAVNKELYECFYFLKLISCSQIYSRFLSGHHDFHSTAHNKKF